MVDGSGLRLAKARPPEGVAGMARLHAMVGELVGDVADEDVEVLVGIETDRPEHAPTTTGGEPAAAATTPPCANSPTDSSASCTAASRPAPTTTR
ncbi:hypothetical protein AB0K14_40015 [Actinosynnema sp. NPDC050801]|uniref:hypothetical protein n=1 Tax=unclassified Actinosynnema TaxID=2637065 RepID=UPI0033E389B3